MSRIPAISMLLALVLAGCAVAPPSSPAPIREPKPFGAGTGESGGGY